MAVYGSQMSRIHLQSLHSSRSQSRPFCHESEMECKGHINKSPYFLPCRHPPFFLSQSFCPSSSPFSTSLLPSSTPSTPPLLPLPSSSFPSLPHPPPPSLLTNVSSLHGPQTHTAVCGGCHDQSLVLCEINGHNTIEVCMPCHQERGWGSEWLGLCHTHTIVTDGPQLQYITEGTSIQCRYHQYLCPGLLKKTLPPFRLEKERVHYREPMVVT